MTYDMERNHGPERKMGYTSFAPVEELAFKRRGGSITASEKIVGVRGLLKGDVTYMMISQPECFSPAVFLL